jgi:hypothetical protein
VGLRSVATSFVVWAWLAAVVALGVAYWLDEIASCEDLDRSGVIPTCPDSADD